LHIGARLLRRGGDAGGAVVGFAGMA
jgi:hypothetical protein